MKSPTNNSPNHDYINNFTELPTEFFEDLICNGEGVDYCGGNDDWDAEIHVSAIDAMKDNPEDCPFIEGLDLEEVKAKLRCRVSFTPSYSFVMVD